MSYATMKRSRNKKWICHVFKSCLSIFSTNIKFITFILYVLLSIIEVGTVSFRRVSTLILLKTKTEEIHTRGFKILIIFTTCSIIMICSVARSCHVVVNVVMVVDDHDDFIQHGHQCCHSCWRAVDVS